MIFFFMSSLSVIDCTSLSLKLHLHYESKMVLVSKDKQQNGHLLLMLIKVFLAPLAVGQRAHVMVQCPSCVRELFL